MALAFEEFITPFGSSGPRMTHGTASPAGTFPANEGDICFNDSFAAGQPWAWVCTVTGTPGTWVPVAQGFASGVPHFYSGTVSPASGTYVQGDISYNSAPSVGAPFAWVCTSGGTPGTWLPIVLLPQNLAFATITATNIPTARWVNLIPGATASPLTLPTAGSVTAGFIMTIKNITSAITLTVVPATGDNYDVGTSAISLTMNQTATIISSGVTNWYKQ